MWSQTLPYMVAPLVWLRLRGSCGDESSPADAIEHFIPSEPVCRIFKRWDKDVIGIGEVGETDSTDVGEESRC